MSRVRFKQAEEASEFEQIHALNHRVFAEEIAQHPQQPTGLLVDRFHEQNRYFIAVDGDAVVGMISAHGGPEFSIAKRLPLVTTLEEFARPLEVRLLAIERRERSRMILAGLLWQVYEHARSHAYSHLLISGICERVPMYEKLGFAALGPAVPDGSASFVPMVMKVGTQADADAGRAGLYERRWRRFAAGMERPVDRGGTPISLMPGPVSIHPEVTRAWARGPVSHRSAAFVERYEEVRRKLGGLVAGDDLQAVMFPGAGTLANDAVAANLKALFDDARGLILANGEFGERIANQARRAGLDFDELRFAWGRAWQFAEIAGALASRPKWIWAVHLETSTGVLNDIERLLALADEAGSAVVLDCVSSLGAAPIRDVTGRLLMASGVSGKSLGSYAGLGFVYLSGECRRMLEGKGLCPSYDLLRMHEARGPMTTVPSPLLFSLECALELHYGSRAAVDARLREYAALGARVRRGLKAAGLEPLAPEEAAAPNITTFALPDAGFADRCLAAGYQIAHESGYLQQRGWGQIATMGDVSRGVLEGLFAAMGEMQERIFVPA